ncbi:MAG: IS30 family transposase [Planctomycetota bacterium]|jgi:IS30 family transposase
MREYRQLTEDDRIEIYAMKQAGKEQNMMAAKLQVHPSTISRELGRNTGLRGYRPKQAQQKALQRRFNACKAVKMTPETIAYIERKLAEDHSPEQIAERMKLDYKHLRIGGTKQRRKRRNSRDMRGTIKNRVGIEDRPPIVERRIRIGDWEGDTVVGKNHQGALVTLVDRKSKLTLIGKVDRYTAEAVEKTIISLMELLPRRSYTLTVDNGKEFASHESVAETLRIKVYFADPYRAWQRGLNENTNGLIRQYVPKGSDVRILTDEQIQHIMSRLNNRPRKSLGYLTPHEVFYERKKLTG